MRFPHISRRNLRAGAGLLALVLALVGISYCGDLCEELLRERRDFASLGDSRDPLVFEDFIAKYPGSRHVATVRKRYKELVDEMAALEAEVMHASQDELRKFVAYNKGQHFLLRLATARLDTIDWREAVGDASQKSMERYISEHPDGAFITEAVEEYNRYERIRLEAELMARRDTTEQETAEPDTFAIEYAGAGM